MPGAPQIQDEIMAISTTVESSYNTYPVLATGFKTFYARSANLPVPGREKFDNTGFLGLQQEGATKQRSGFTIAPSIEFGGDVDTGICATFTRRALGKADPTPAGGDILHASDTFQHHFALLGNRTAAGRQLPSSSMLFSNDNIDYIYWGCVFNQMTFTQNGAEIPQYSASMLGSGGYKKVSTIAGFGTLTPPVAPALDNVMMGGETEVEYTDPNTTKFLAKLDYGAASVLKNISATLVNNNLDAGDKRAGSKRLDSTTPTKGWVLSYLLHGVRSSVAQFRVEAQSGVDELANALQDAYITDFKWRMFGEFLATGNATYRHTFEIRFPQCYFRNVARVDDGGGLFLDIGVFPVSSGATNDPDFVEVRVVNGVATAIN